MKKTIYIVLSAIALASCGGSEKNTTTTEQGPKKDQPHHLDMQRTFTIEGKSILFLKPTEAKMDAAVAKIKKENGEDGLAEIASDEGLYMGEASDFALSKGLKLHNTTSEIIQFKKEDGTSFRLENTLDGIGGEVYMFDGKKDPQKVQNLPTFSDGKEFDAYFGAATLNPIFKQLQGKWAPVSNPSMFTEDYEADIVTIMPNQQYRVRIDGEYLVYTPLKNAKEGFKRKLKKVGDKDFTFQEGDDKEISKLVRVK